MDTLPLHNMHLHHNGLTKAIAETYTEAARVCLDRHQNSPREFGIEDDGSENTVLVEWEQTDDRTRGAWANETDATCMGAYACALAATEIQRGLVAVHRAETHSGADYYIGPLGATKEDLEECFRLEVSGSDQERSVIKTRLRIKVEQARNGNSNLPAIAAVVGFRTGLILIETVTLNDVVD